MDKQFETLLENIPAYERFYTLAELDDSSLRLAEAHPDCVKLREVGRTREGRALLMLSIFCDDPEADNALMLGCPHPNEPIGAMMLEYFSGALAEDKALRDRLGYHFHILKVWDADGAVRNEGWFGGPFTITNYFRHYFRPAGNEQVDWTFPIRYKKLDIDDPLPETKAAMKLIDELKPTFLYTLHNSGFGGAYWYMTRPLQQLFDPLREVARKYGIPLHLGEPESRMTQIYAPAFYANLGLANTYDHMEAAGADMDAFAASRRSGDSSAGYARTRYGTLTLLTELPYFMDERIVDATPSKVTRREAMIERNQKNAARNAEIHRILDPVLPIIGTGDPRVRAVLNFTTPNSSIAGLDGAYQREIERPENQRPATVAELFDMRYISMFYKLQNYGMAMQALNEIAEGLTGGDAGCSGGDEEKITAVADARDAMGEAFERLAAELESNVHYQVEPIRNLVAVQLASGLLVADELKKH